MKRKKMKILPHGCTRPLEFEFDWETGKSGFGIGIESEARMGGVLSVAQCKKLRDYLNDYLTLKSTDKERTP